MKGLRALLLAFLALPASLSRTADAATLRYALILGNDRGLDASGNEPLPALRHASAEARRLRDQLVRLSNFDPAGDRTVLLLGATREQVWQAVHRIQKRKREDLRTLGDAQTLFMFYFSGHGLQGRLLLADGPVTTVELAKVFREVDADLSLGVFDACHSASFEPSSLARKGIDATPGFNLFRELPEEVLTAEGSIWYVSSGPDEPSFEDERLGGVFTHFFTEALERADQDGPGITLDRIWNYARDRTVAHAVAMRRLQIPQQIVNYRGSAPLYFSFPKRRNATLELGEAVHGQFVLDYADGRLVERIQKKAGQRRTLAVYPGRARLLLVDGEQVLTYSAIEFLPDSTMVLAHTAPASNLARQTRWLVKGFGPQKLAIGEVVGRPAVFLGVSYGVGVTHGDQLAAMHAVTLDARLDRGAWLAGVRAGYGTDAMIADAWSYRLHAAVTRFRAGYGWDLLSVRIALEAAFGWDWLWTRYRDGARASGWSVRPEGGLSLFWPASESPGAVALELAVRGGANYAPTAVPDGGSGWSPAFSASVSLFFRVM